MLQETIHNSIMGAIQGISEFLPISSSGHLVVIPRLFGWNYEGLAFDVALHFGTLIAILLFFWRDWVTIIANGIKTNQTSNIKMQDDTVNCKNNPHSNPLPGGQGEGVPSPFQGEGRGEVSNSQFAIRNYPNNLLWQIMVASIPAAIVGLTIQDIVEAKLHSSYLIAFNLAVFGIVLWYVDRVAQKNSTLSAISFKHSFLIGIAQSIALMPGVSRSGITMTAARGLGYERETAARFSFLVATPAMFGAFVLSLGDMDILSAGTPFWLGVLVSAVAGFAAIKYLLQYLKNGSFAVFMWYRLVIALVVVAMTLVG